MKLKNRIQIWIFALLLTLLCWKFIAVFIVTISLLEYLIIETIVGISYFLFIFVESQIKK